MNKNLEFLKNPIIAHRGMHNIALGIPENSLAAFELAIENDYTIELDLHVLKDNQVVVFHDDNLKRMTGIDRNIKDVTYDEIKDLKLQNTNYHIPLFEEVLKLINNKVAILIELKTDVKHFRLEKMTANILKKYGGIYAIQSFSHSSIYWFKKNEPSIVRGRLSSASNRENILNSLIDLFTQPDFLSYEIFSLPNKLVTNYRTNHLVLGWTIKNQEDLCKAIKYCDNYICENISDLSFRP